MKKIHLLSTILFCYSVSIAQNLVTNGNFSSGNTSFTTGYDYDCTNVPIGEQKHCVGTNPNAVHFAWAACGDHTTGTGNMQIVNGTSTPNVKVWEQVVNVTPNTCYKFSVWATSVYSGNPAKIRLAINTATSAFVQLSSTTCAWQEISDNWNSGAATTATLTIWDDDLNPDGNDFAIDDVSLIPIPSPCTPTILPLKWVNINVSGTNANNIIRWTTNNEINVVKFIIEESANGVNFTNIGTVNAKESNSINNYEFTTLTKSKSFLYYRIKQIDRDGLFSYSPITRMSSQNNSDIKILQNPIQQNIKIGVSSSSVANYTLVILNINGQKLYQESFNSTTGYQQKIISSNRLNSGVYYIKLTNNTNLKTTNFSFFKQ